MKTKQIMKIEAMYKAFLKSRPKPAGNEYSIVPSHRSGTTLADLKRQVNSLSDEEFILTIDI